MKCVAMLEVRCRTQSSQACTTHLMSRMRSSGKSLLTSSSVPAAPKLFSLQEGGEQVVRVVAGALKRALGIPC
jgi:hypothetical protein